jgi:hypothetical protein
MSERNGITGIMVFDCHKMRYERRRR